MKKYCTQLFKRWIRWMDSTIQHFNIQSLVMFYLNSHNHRIFLMDTSVVITHTYNVCLKQDKRRDYDREMAWKRREEEWASASRKVILTL